MKSLSMPKPSYSQCHHEATTNLISDLCPGWDIEYIKEDVESDTEGVWSADDIVWSSRELLCKVNRSYKYNKTTITWVTMYANKLIIYYLPMVATFTCTCMIYQYFICFRFVDYITWSKWKHDKDKNFWINDYVTMSTCDTTW